MPGDGYVCAEGVLSLAPRWGKQWGFMYFEILFSWKGVLQRAPLLCSPKAAVARLGRS